MGKIHFVVLGIVLCAAQCGSTIYAAVPTVSRVASDPTATLGTTDPAAFTFKRDGSTSAGLAVNVLPGSRVGQRSLRQVRPWIEPAPALEKNQLGLSWIFFNRLRLTWQMSLLAASAVLLRTMAPGWTHQQSRITSRG
jgi:hypothetical protein